MSSLQTKHRRQLQWPKIHAIYAIHLDHMRGCYKEKSEFTIILNIQNRENIEVMVTRHRLAERFKPAVWKLTSGEATTEAPESTWS